MIIMERGRKGEKTSRERRGKKCGGRQDDYIFNRSKKEFLKIIIIMG